MTFFLRHCFLYMGHQIEWIATEKMTKWWKTLIEELDQYDIIYCLNIKKNI